MSKFGTGVFSSFLSFIKLSIVIYLCALLYIMFVFYVCLCVCVCVCVYVCVQGRLPRLISARARCPACLHAAWYSASIMRLAVVGRGTLPLPPLPPLPLTPRLLMLLEPLSMCHCHITHVDIECVFVCTLVVAQSRLMCSSRMLKQLFGPVKAFNVCRRSGMCLRGGPRT